MTDVTPHFGRPGPGSRPPTPPRLGEKVVPVSDFRMLGGIELLEQLGRGGQGHVFRGRVVNNPALNQLALKLTGGLPLSDATAARLTGLRDTNSYGVRHPGIVPVLAAGESRDHGPFLLSELVPGVNLAEWVARHGRLDPKRAAEVVARAADALDAVHRTDLVHCDIKPSNLFGCDPDATAVEPTAVRVGDFGLSQPPSEADPDRRTAGGTPPYMPPERLVGETTPHGDVFSLGMTLVHLVSGGVPVPPGRLAAVKQAIARHLHAPLPPEVEADYTAVLGLVRAAVGGSLGETALIADPVLRAVVLCCLAARPQDRYPSAAALRDDLTRWLQDRPTTESNYPYTRREVRELFYRRCRRPEPLFAADQARLWGWCSLALIASALPLAWGGSVAVARGADPDDTPLLTVIVWMVLFVIPITAYAAVTTRWRGVAGQFVWFIGGYVSAVFPINLFVLNKDVITLTQVVWAVSGLATLLIGLADPIWGRLKWLGAGVVALTTPVCLLLQRYPDEFRPWCAGIMSFEYVVLFAIIALRIFGRANQLDRVTAGSPAHAAQV